MEDNYVLASNPSRPEVKYPSMLDPSKKKKNQSLAFTNTFIRSSPGSSRAQRRDGP